MKLKNHFKALLPTGLILLYASQVCAQPVQPGSTVPVLIGFGQTPGPAERGLVQAFGGTIRHSYTLVPAIAARLPQSAIQALQQHPLVTVIEPDGLFHAIDAELDNTWGVKRIGAGAVHDTGNTGSEVKVCVIDSGIDTTHTDLLTNYAGGNDFVNGDSDPSDDNGHGTHVAGTVAALMNSTGVRGAAPRARILAYKVLGANGSGSFSAVIAAVQACVLAGGKVTNNSYGSSGDPGTLVKQAFDNAYYEAGVLHVGAAGNSGNLRGTGDNVGYPARWDSVIAVSATNNSDGRASFSSTGSTVEIAAPGVNIPSTYPGNKYATMSGTSMASPHVAGTAALVLACGVTGVNNVRLRLQQTAQDLGAKGRDPLYGFGLVRADLAATGCVPATNVTDVAITSVSGPASVQQGTSATIAVGVANVGNQPAATSFSVTLTTPTGPLSQNVSSLAAGASATLSFVWANTAGAAPGDYTLTATHSYADSNDANDSASTTINVTAASAGGITLAASGYKVKGVQMADLSWSGATSVTVFRNSSQIATLSNSGSYTDNINNKGGGTYVYRVCAGTTCSNEATVTF